MPSRIIYPGQGGSDGGGGPSPGGGVLPSIMVPYQNPAQVAVSSTRYINWRSDDVTRANSVDGSSILGCLAADPTKIFTIPPSPSFSKINILLAIEPIIIGSAIYVGLSLHKNGGVLPYKNISSASKRLASTIGNTQGGEVFELMGIPIQAGDYFQLYATVTSTNLYFSPATSSTTTDQTQLSFCRVEEVI